MSPRQARQRRHAAEKEGRAKSRTALPRAPRHTSPTAKARPWRAVGCCESAACASDTFFWKNTCFCWDKTSQPRSWCSQHHTALASDHSSAAPDLQSKSSSVAAAGAGSSQVVVFSVHWLQTEHWSRTMAWACAHAFGFPAKTCSFDHMIRAVQVAGWSPRVQTALHGSPLGIVVVGPGVVVSSKTPQPASLGGQPAHSGH